MTLQYPANFLHFLQSINMQEGKKSLHMLKMCNLDRIMFTFSAVAYIAVDFKKLVSDLNHIGLLW